MYKNIYRQTKTMELGIELLDLNYTIQAQEIQIEDLRIKAAKYKAYFFGKTKLAEILENQMEENYNACVGEFDGFMYASWRANAVYRTLEDMARAGMISEAEYRFCEA